VIAARTAWRRRWLPEARRLWLFAIAILAVNAFTVWFVMRPKRTLTPKYTVLPAGPEFRLGHQNGRTLG